MKTKYKVFKIISVDDDNYLPSRIFDMVIIVLIILSIVSVVLSTFDNLPTWINSIMTRFEYISIFVFTIEYLLRVWTADYLYPGLGKIKCRIKYIFSFMAIIDLIAILPFYLPFVTNIDLRALRILRLFRMARIFKINRYTDALNTVSNVLIKKKDQLLSSMSVVLILMLISSILMYYCEHDAQPDVFDNALSGFWWAIATLTTVGYGDIYPITALGKILSACMAMLGIGLVAVPTGIISAGFTEEIENSKEDDDEITYCPYCGKKIR